jgi:hypothetical protein
VIAIFVVALMAGGTGCGSSGESEAERPTPAELRSAEAERQREAREQRRVEAEIRAEERQGAQAKSEPEPESEPASGGFTGALAKRYQEDKELCGLFPASQIAKEYGVPAGADPVTIAEAYADGYQPQFHQAAFEGCLDGLGS